MKLCVTCRCTPIYTVGGVQPVGMSELSSAESEDMEGVVGVGERVGGGASCQLGLQLN